MWPLLYACNVWRFFALTKYRLFRFSKFITCEINNPLSWTIKKIAISLKFELKYMYIKQCTQTAFNYCGIIVFLKWIISHAVIEKCKPVLVYILLQWQLMYFVITTKSCNCNEDINTVQLKMYNKYHKLVTVCSGKLWDSQISNYIHILYKLIIITI